jgi:hypothetical protein
MRPHVQDRRTFIRRAAIGLGATALSADDASVAAQTAPAPIQMALELRKQELQRRVDALPAEVGRWLARGSNEPELKIHFSQLQSLNVLMQAFTVQHLAMLGSLKPNGGAANFLQQSSQLGRATK